MQKILFKTIALAIFILLSTIIFVTPLPAAVYKHVDEQGNVSYSDVPQKKGDKPVSMPEPMTFKPVTPLPATPKTATTESRKKPTKTEKIVKYDSISIASPKNDEAVRSNSGDITVEFSSSPGLQGKHIYVVLLDGSKIREGSATTITLSNVERGTHSVAVQIQDENAQTLLSSAPVTFHLLRHSIIKR